MKRQLRAALEALLAERVPAALGPRYVRARLPRGEGYLVLPGEIAYGDATRGGMGRFVCFVPDQKRPAFTVELAWSADGQFPAATARPSTSPGEALSARPARGFVRLSEFYSRLGEDWDVSPLDVSDPTSLDRWLELEMRELGPEEARALMEPLVADALARLQQYAPSFFDALGGTAPAPGEH
jgi:hypothetical protein